MAPRSSLLGMEAARTTSCVVVVACRLFAERSGHAWTSAGCVGACWRVSSAAAALAVSARCSRRP